MENHFMPNKGGKLCINVQNRTHFRRLELHPKIKNQRQCIPIEYDNLYGLNVIRNV